MREIPVGDLPELITLCYEAGTPLLVYGSTGVGKSASVAYAARKIGGVWPIDLALVQVTDLIGLPFIKGGKTTFAVPSMLPPPNSVGILLMEELGRAAPDVQSASLQLLTARRLNDYTLPAGVLPVALTNPPGGEYVGVYDLDAAVRARFLEVRVVASVPQWVHWGRETGRIDAAVLSFAEKHVDLFDDRQSNPRAWEMVSRILRAAADSTFSPELLEAAIEGLVGAWAKPFLKHLASADPLIDPIRILRDYAGVKPIVQSWRRAKRNDLMRTTLDRVLREVALRGFRALDLDNVDAFVRDLPAEFRRFYAGWRAEELA